MNCPRCGGPLRQTRELDGYQWWCIAHGEVSLRTLEVVPVTPKRGSLVAGQRHASRSKSESA